MSNNKLKIITIILTMVAITVLGAVVVIYLQDKREIETSKKLYRQKVSVDQVDLYKDINFVTCYKNDFTIRKIGNDKYEMTCYVGNSSENIYNNMYFELYLKEDDTLIYKSGVIPKGKCVEKVEIDDVSLKKGTYKGKLVYYIIDDEGELIKTVFVEVSVATE